MARSEIQSNPVVEVKMNLIGRRSKDGRTYNLPSANEVAALIVGDLDPSMGDLDILIESRTGQLKRINQLNPAYLPLQYPLLFPYGEDGYREDISFSDAWRQGHHGGRKRISPEEYFSFYIHERVNENHTLLYSRRLFQQYLVDAYTMIESTRLIYIRTHQKALRCEAYQGLSDALTRGELDPTGLSDALTRGELDPTGRGKRIILPSSFTTGRGKRIILPSSFTGGASKRIILPSSFTGGARYMIILPSSFTGGARYMIKNYQDAMAICRQIGYPHLFITFTCNPKWPEIERYVAHHGLKLEDRPDIICGVIYTIEFQKRGLPHAHILLFAKKINRANSATEIDAIISTEIPDPDADTKYHDVVGEFMLHRPCGQLRKNSPCMINGKCSKEMIRVTAEFMSSSTNGRNGDVVDEINMYYDCRYISACEATWRLFGYVIHYRTPLVERLNFHLEHQQNVVYGEDQTLDEIVENQTVKQSQFTAWFEANKKYEDARSLSYAEFPVRCGELYYLRCLLNLIRGPSSHDDIRTVAGVIHKSYRDACYEYRLLDDDKEYIDSITDLSYWASASALRQLFATLLSSSTISRPEVVRDAVWEFLAEDAQFHHRRRMNNLDSDKKQFALVELEKLLSLWGKSLRDFPDMPLLDETNIGFMENMLIAEELAYDKESLKIEHETLAYDKESLKIEHETLVYDKESLKIEHETLVTQLESLKIEHETLVTQLTSLKIEHETLVTQLTDEQKNVYDSVMNDIDCNGGGLFFVYGYGGTGKTFVWRTLSSMVRSRGDIVLNVASSGIASLLLPGGRTAHSRFAIPLSLNEDSTCNISQGSDLAELIIRRKLIIWDEAPMTHKHCFEALDKTMRDLLRFVIPGSAEKTFGGKTVVLGGDFRQILLVIPKATRPIVVGATINSSYLWTNCKVLRLTKNLRLRSLASDEDRQTVDWFSKWIANIGDGITGVVNNGLSEIDIPQRSLSWSLQWYAPHCHKIDRSYCGSKNS
ncbi:uncharacterized protein LOC116024309 [Ipomoea triloba]|uniref:uncharacterized protein LOC116024309 n=1 Tax=Ipomoea triloba TaxID=35885 RepID=UPI00125DF606|nr:uncharacterized protein LOC116024309 [Ipomoea triloba]